MLINLVRTTRKGRGLSGVGDEDSYDQRRGEHAGTPTNKAVRQPAYGESRPPT